MTELVRMIGIGACLFAVFLVGFYSGRNSTLKEKEP